MRAFLFRALFPTPEPCPFCSRPIGSERQETVPGVRLCSSCDEGIDWIREPICECCGRALEPRDDALVCHDCRRRDDAHLFRNRAVARYNSTTRHIVSLFKYRGQETLARPIGQLMAEVVRRQYRTERFAALTYVPLHPTRAAERGFNQAERLARIIGRELRRPVLSLLTREQETAKQSQKGRRDRLAGMDGVFRLESAAYDHPLRGKTVLVVDDVYTTGATLTACVRMLYQAGVASVRTVTFIR